eukprot:7245668-Alexandrium_andersonii.AAC.1
MCIRDRSFNRSGPRSRHAKQGLPKLRARPLEEPRPIRQPTEAPRDRTPRNRTPTGTARSQR